MIIGYLTCFDSPPQSAKVSVDFGLLGGGGGGGPVGKRNPSPIPLLFPLDPPAVLSEPGFFAQMNATFPFH